MKPPTDSAAPGRRPAPKMKEIRAVAALLRAGEKPEVSPQLLARAKTHLRNRAQYNARRARVRALAAKMRRGRKPRAPADIIASVKRHLAYRAWYNEDRRNERKQNAK